jgi:Fur family zinc uptake transcriptional regulator
MATGSSEAMSKQPRKRRSAPDQDKLIVDALRDVGRPLSAYEIIDQLKDKGLSAPPTVYRALNRLIEDGLAHRLESLNAFVACRHPHHGGTAVFTICSQCGAVREFHEPEAVDRLATAAAATGFDVKAMTIELRGRCGDCRQGAPADVTEGSTDDHDHSHD